MNAHLKAWIGAVTAASVGLTPVLSEFAQAQTLREGALATPAPPGATARGLSRADYQACQTQDETEFRTAIETITLEALQRGLDTIDYRALVNEEWRRANVDATLDREVEAAVTDVRKNTSWGTLLSSLAYKEEAQKLATRVAEQVYRSDDMKEALEVVAVGVGTKVGERIDDAGTDAADPAAKCVRAFLGERYGSTVADAVTSDTATELEARRGTGTATIGSGAVLKETSGGIAGAAILLIRRQLANLARSVGQRLVGSILSRLVSVVAGGIGLVLIAKDIWDLRYGVLPIIATEMKAEGTKEKVREELALAMQSQIGDQVGTIASATADRIIEIWREFRAAHAAALDIAERNADFRSFLDGLRPDELGRLDEVVSLTLPSEGEKGLLDRVRNGTLREAVRGLPDAAMQIARENRSLDNALAWHAVAGDSIEGVVRNGLHRAAAPDAFTRTSLDRVLALDDPVAVTRIARLDAAPREALFELDPGDLRKLARTLTADELQTLSSYLTGLEQGPRQQVLAAIAEAPAKMRILASKRVRDAVVASADQSAAVEMMLRDKAFFDPAAALHDIALAWEGRVSPMLLIDKHPFAVGLMALIALMLILMVRRLFTRPGKTVRAKAASPAKTTSGEHGTTG